MSIDRLPTGMAAIYGDFEFGSTTETTALNITPVYDTSGRTVIYSVYSITLRTHLAADTVEELDVLVKEARAQLTAPAADFSYFGRGIGNVQVNLGRVKDVVWGPKPKMLSLSPIGAGRVVELTWQVDFAVPTCSDATFAFNAMEFNYKLSYVRDREGYTTRTYSGFIRIPQTRKSPSDRTLSDSADAYLEKITPPVPPGFDRIEQSWTLDESKCRGDFSITDKQLERYAPPPGCLKANVSHQWRTHRNMADWLGILTGEYLVIRDVDSGVAINDFFGLLTDRTRPIEKEMRNAEGDLLGPNKWFPVSASITEQNIYGRKQISMSITYTVSGTFIGEIMRHGGLFIPPWPNGRDGWNNWQGWMSTAWSPRGYANMRFSVGDDRIVDLCRPAQPQTPSQQAVPVQTSSGTSLQTSRTFEAFLKSLRPPDPKNSWLLYRPLISISPDTGRVVLETLPNAALPLSPGASEWNALGPLPTTTGRGPFPPLSSSMTASPSYGGKTHVQQRTRPTLYVTFAGEALRIGYPIPCPELITVNGVRPVLVGQPVFTQGVVFQSTVPIYRAEWQMTYVFCDEGGVPTQAIPVPPTHGLA